GGNHDGQEKHRPKKRDAADLLVDQKRRKQRKGQDDRDIDDVADQHVDQDRHETLVNKERLVEVVPADEVEPEPGHHVDLAEGELDRVRKRPRNEDQEADQPWQDKEVPVDSLPLPQCESHSRIPPRIRTKSRGSTVYSPLDQASSRKFTITLDPSS